MHFNVVLHGTLLEMPTDDSAILCSNSSFSDFLLAYKFYDIGLPSVSDIALLIPLFYIDYRTNIMSGSNTTTTQQPLTPGAKVKLTTPILGTIEKDVVYNDVNDASNRKDHTLPAQSEVSIRRTQPRNLLAASTGAGAIATDVDYTFEKTLDKQFYRLVTDTTTVITEFKIPHYSLAKTRGGQPSDSEPYNDKEYLYLIEDFSYKVQGKDIKIPANEIIQVWGKAVTKSGGEVRRGTVRSRSHLASVTYPFRVTTSAKKPVHWRSKAFHPASVFVRV
ncbi:hypothetical protein CVT26_004932 [Gymnopilus dilepis]|uniref:Uncharacterized protein n=1 Tax=Gymnopilus dilepis TaxID=231916 RepID=A0A409YJ48_9AGAR|nr:hypothetical protein CVT26_004932 [Gymnopilus dilepis]